MRFTPRDIPRRGGEQARFSEIQSPLSPHANIIRVRMTRWIEYVPFFTDLTGAERVDLLDGAMRSGESLVDTSRYFKNGMAWGKLS